MGLVLPVSPLCTLQNRHSVYAMMNSTPGCHPCLMMPLRHVLITLQKSHLTVSIILCIKLRAFVLKLEMCRCLRLRFQLVPQLVGGYPGATPYTSTQKSARKKLLDLWICTRRYRPHVFVTPLSAPQLSGSLTSSMMRLEAAHLPHSMPKKQKFTKR